MPDPFRAAIEQLSYLCDEVGALKEVLPRLDDEVLSSRPFEGEPTIKERFSSIRVLDEAVRTSVVEDGLHAMEASVGLATHGNDWRPEPVPEANAQRVEDLLDEVVLMRRRLVAQIEDRVKDLGEDNMEGMTVVLSYLHSIIHQDTEILRRIAERIHEIQPARG